MEPDLTTPQGIEDRLLDLMETYQDAEVDGVSVLDGTTDTSAIAHVIDEAVRAHLASLGSHLLAGAKKRLADDPDRLVAADYMVDRAIESLGGYMTGHYGAAAFVPDSQEEGGGRGTH